MPTNPNIPFMVNPAFIDLGALRDQARERQDADTRRQVNALAMQDAAEQRTDRQTKRAKDQQFNALIGSTGGDKAKLETARAQAWTIGPEEGLALDEIVAKLTATEKKKLDERLEAHATLSFDVLQLPLAQQPAAYAAGQQQLVKSGHLTAEEVAGSPYPGTAALQQRVSQVQTLQQRIASAAAEKKAAADVAQKARDDDRLDLARTEQNRHNEAMETIQGSTANRAEAAQRETVRHNEAMEAIAADREVRLAAGGGSSSTAGKDDPELPRGVVDYLHALSQKPNADYTTAQQEVDRIWPKLLTDHPKLDRLKTRAALRTFFQAPPGGEDPFAGLSDTPPAAPPPPAPAPVVPPTPFMPQGPPMPPPAQPSFGPTAPMAPAGRAGNSVAAPPTPFAPPAPFTPQGPPAPPPAPPAPTGPAVAPRQPGEVFLTLPDGTIGRFANQAALEAFAKRHNLTLSK